MKRGLSILLCMIIICLPVAFAKELSITRLSGLDGVEGYYTYNDGINITVKAALESEPNGIQPDQLIIYIDGTRNERFDSCEQETGSLYECRFDRLYGPAPGEHEYEIRLYSDDNKFNEDAIPEMVKTKTFVLDMIPPDITSFTITPPISSDGRITLQWSLEDFAMDQGNTNLCSGIQKTEFYLENEPTTPFLTVPGLGECIEDWSYDHQIIGIPDGTKSITAKSYDKLGQFQITEPVQFSLDTGGPSVNSSGTKVYDEEGEVRWLKSTDNILATIEIPIIDDNPGLVKADFSKLTTYPGHEDKRATRIEENMAIWENIRIRDFKQCQITVRATDTFNHITTKTVDCDVILDDIPPELLSLQTDRPSEDEIYMFGVDTSVIAQLRDMGSGVSSETIFLDLREVTGETTRPADECIESQNGLWECEWLITATRREGLREIKLARISSDRAGNRITDTTPLGVEVYLDAPEFGDYNIRVLPGEESGAPVLVKDAMFELSVDVTGHLIDEVEVDLGNIGGDIEEMQCNTDRCEIITQVPGSGPRETNITITARNRAGNPAHLVVPVTVYGLLEGEPNYWTPEVRCSPSRIDRRTASLVDTQVFCDLNLQNPNQNIQPVAVQFDGIVGCDEQAGNYAADMSLLNGQNSRHPTMAIRLFDNDYPMTSIMFNCPIRIYTSVTDDEGPKIHMLPEEEDILYSMGFYNQALGDLYDNLDGQVNRAVQDAKDYMSWVSKLTKFFDMASKFCNIKTTLSNIWSAIDAITYIVGGMADVAPTPADLSLQQARHGLCRTSNSFDRLFANEKWSQAERGAGPNIEGSKFIGNKAKGGLWGFLDKMCTFVNCRASSSDEGFLKDLGGGSQICQDSKEFLKELIDVPEVPVIDAERRVTDYQAQFPQNFDVKNSLILSSMCLCVPGIIENLNKLREIKCEKALCMKNEVRENGLPPSVCNDIEAYLTCNFVVGDIFSLFPIAKFWSKVTDLLSTMLADPSQLIIGYLGLQCRGFCDMKGTSIKYKMCKLPKTLAKVGDAINSIKGIKNIESKFDMEPASGACDRLEAMEDDNV